MALLRRVHMRVSAPNRPQFQLHRSKYFSAFCVITYDADETVFTERQFCEYMDRALGGKSISTGAKAIDFLYDATYIIGIMKKDPDADKYSFIHDSFQQYFTAYFLSEHWHERAGFINYFLNKDPASFYEDYTLDLLYGMRRKEMDLDFFYPYFKKLLDHYNTFPDPYWAFIVDLYPLLEITWLPKKEYMIQHINAYKKVIDMNIPSTCSTSYLYEAFIYLNNFQKVEQLNKLVWPKGFMDVFDGELFYWSLDYNPDDPYGYSILSDHLIVQIWPMCDHEQLEREGILGYHFTIKTKAIDDTTLSGELMRKFNRDWFPLKEEYDDLVRWVELKEEEVQKGESKKNANSLSSIFDL